MAQIYRHFKLKGQNVRPHHFGLALLVLKNLLCADIAAWSYFGKPQPTISFDIKGISPTDICKYLGEKGICAWNGHFYGIRSIEILGYIGKGVVTRVGVSVYNTIEEADRLISAIQTITSGVQINWFLWWINFAVKTHKQILRREQWDL